MTIGLAQNRQLIKYIILPIIVLLCSFIISLSVGPADISFVQISKALVDRLPILEVNSGLSQIEQDIVWQIRIPRIILGGLVGAALATAGASYQGIFRNPLADPYLLGVASGAGLGASVGVALAITNSILGLTTIGLMSLLGALIAVVITVVLAKGSFADPARILLAGIATATFASALQALILFVSSQDIARIYFWLLGGLETNGYEEVLFLTPVVFLGLLILFIFSPLLNVASLSDDEVSSLGVSPQRIRIVIIFTSTFLTAGAVAVSGLIGFVGLVVPHFVRLGVSKNYKVLLPTGAVFGASFLILSDTISRAVPMNLPIGIITALIGGPAFAIILLGAKND